MSLTPQQLGDSYRTVIADLEMSNSLTPQQIVDAYRNMVDYLCDSIRGRDLRIMILQELVSMRDSSVSSLMTSLNECHSQMDMLQKENKLLEMENEQLKEHINDLERRPKPLPYGLPELTRAALDQVRKWDADVRVDEQKKTICNLDRAVKHSNKEIEGLIEDNYAFSTGSLIEMKDFWRHFGHTYHIEGDPEDWELLTYEPSEKLFDFMCRLILMIHDEEDEEEGRFGFSRVLPEVSRVVAVFTTL